MANVKKNIPLIIALSIPLLMIALIAACIYLPLVFMDPPKYNFIYTTQAHYCQDYYYSVRNKRIESRTRKVQENFNCASYEPSGLYYYDVSEDRTWEITLEEAQEHSVDGHRESPDGFEIVHGSYSSGFLFYGGSSRYHKYYKKGAYSQKINDKSISRYNFQFLGWIKE